MKNLILLIIILNYSCKSSTDQKKPCYFESINIKNEFQNITIQESEREKILTGTNEQFNIKTKNYSITFFEVKSIDDNPSGDFRVEHKGDSIFVFRNFLESDDLFSKKFQIKSELIDSLKVRAKYHNGYLFFGEEKKVSSLNINVNSTGFLSREQNLFYPYEILKSEPKDSQTALEVLERAKCLNKEFYYKIIESENYGDSDKENAKKQLKDLNSKKSINDFFIEYNSIKTFFDLKYYISGKEHNKTIICVSNDFDLE